MPPFRLEVVKNTWPVSSGRLPREPAVKLDICKGSVSSTTKQGAMSDNREPEVTDAPSADARSVEAVVEAIAGARGPANFTMANVFYSTFLNVFFYSCHVFLRF